jgi:hypothetical protein
MTWKFIVESVTNRSVRDFIKPCGDIDIDWSVIPEKELVAPLFCEGFASEPLSRFGMSD